MRAFWHEWGHALSLARATADDVTAGPQLLSLAPAGVGEYIRGEGYRRRQYIGRWSGRSELAEKFVGGISREVWGNGAPSFDQIQMGNQEPYRREGNHIWKNNGLATAINVP